MEGTCYQGRVLVLVGNLRRSIPQRVTNTDSAVIGEVNTNVRHNQGA